MKFRKTEAEVFELTRKLQWWLDQYEIVVAPVCLLGAGICFGHEWPISASGDIWGGVLYELLPTFVGAVILYGAMWFRHRLSEKVIATHKEMFNDTLSRRGCPIWLILVTAAVAFLALFMKAFFTTVLMALLAAGGWMLIILSELGRYLLCIKIYRIINGSEQTSSESKTNVIEPEWYTRVQRSRGKPIESESPQGHHFTPTGKIDVKANAQSGEITVVIEMKETDSPSEDS